jgi:electron transfer flavoprotein alpha subunit
MNQDIFVLIEHVRGQVADISYMLLAQARQIARATGGQVYAILLGHNAASLAQDLAADHVWYVDHPSLADFNWDAYQQVLAKLIAQPPSEAAQPPRLVLFGDTTIGADLAGVLSVKLNLPLVGFCRQVLAEGNCLTYVSQVCGGKMMVEGIIPEGTTLVMLAPGKFKVEDGKSAVPPALDRLPAPALEELRVALKQYIDPPAGDVDITRQPLLVAIGRGIQREDNLELAKELVDALGATLCGTRPVVDQGWLPTTRLVGKSGKAVKPKVYLALGVSGAPEHTEAITGSEMIIAINSDPAAPIFDLARYGATVDLLDLLPVLTEKVQQFKDQ